MEKRIASRACHAGAPSSVRLSDGNTPSACRGAQRRQSDTLEEYLGSFDARDAGSTTNDFLRLLEVGIDLPDPALLSDQDVVAKLWEVIGALAALRVYLSSTNHLGDRELYSVLWATVLRQEVEPLGDRGVWHVDLICGAGERAARLYLKHYADERERQQWAAQFPDDPIPAHEDPPFDRDRKLPKP